ncbi:MAG: DNA replication and repair protein RecF [Bacteroidia bacterium]
MQQIKISQFKNHKSTALSFNKSIVCFTGLNGMGKTNMLDAIHYLSTGKSAQNSVDSQNILKGQQFFTIEGTFKSKEETNIFCGFTQGRKKVLKKNGNEYDKLIEHYGRFPAVMVAPTDLVLVTEGNEERRKFIDSSISFFDTDYLSTLVKYNQVLQQRNSFLKQAKETNQLNEGLLQVYNQQMHELCQALYPKRSEFINEVEPLFAQFANTINQDQEALQIKYKSQLANNDLFELFEKNFDRERILGRTECGIHKDKLEFSINGDLLKKFGSQGQQKSYVLALKLAQAKLIESKTGRKPILLLDDLFDRLDNERAARILELANDTFEQIFITDTSKPRLKSALEKVNKTAQFFKVENGEVDED